MSVEKASSIVDQLVKELGLDKLAAEGESGRVISDPGTSHPAEQEQEDGNIQKAEEGARSSENNADIKKNVNGESIAEAKGGDAVKKGGGAASDPLSSSYVGEDPSVEQDYKSNLPDSDTAHPADLDKDPEKYSSDLRSAAESIKKEASVIATSDKTVGERIATLTIGKQASADERDASICATVEDYIKGYVKTASVIGALTADAIALMSKQSQELGPDEAAALEAEMANMSPEELAMLEAEMGGGGMGAEGMPAEGMGAEGMGAEGMPAEGGEDIEAAFLAAAEEVAAELGVPVEAVLEAALAEAEGGGDEGMPMEAEGMPMEAEGMPMEEGPAEEVLDEEKLASLKEKAAEWDNYTAKEAELAKKAELQTSVRSAVEEALQKLINDKQK